MTNPRAEAAKEALRAVQGLAADLPGPDGPPPDGGLSLDEEVLPLSVVRDTRGYIETITHQINGTFAKGWYDACAVMMRRLLETLIIEVFESRGLASKIQTTNGDFVRLEDLVGKVIGEPSWNLSRRTKRVLPDVKDLGDDSAHNRRFNAHQRDILLLRAGFRTAVQELVRLADLKR